MAIIKKRCLFCRKVLRPDGTCQYEKCPRYTPEKSHETEELAKKSEK